MEATPPTHGYLNGGVFTARGGGGSNESDQMVETRVVQLEVVAEVVGRKSPCVCPQQRWGGRRRDRGRRPTALGQHGAARGVRRRPSATARRWRRVLQVGRLAPWKMPSARRARAIARWRRLGRHAGTRGTASAHLLFPRSSALLHPPAPALHRVLPSPTVRLPTCRLARRVCARRAQDDAAAPKRRHRRRCRPRARRVRRRRAAAARRRAGGDRRPPHAAVGALVQMCAYAEETQRITSLLQEQPVDVHYIDDESDHEEPHVKRATCDARSAFSRGLLPPRRRQRAYQAERPCLSRSALSGCCCCRRAAFAARPWRSSTARASARAAGSSAACCRPSDSTRPLLASLRGVACRDPELRSGRRCRRAFRVRRALFAFLT